MSMFRLGARWAILPAFLGGDHGENGGGTAGGGRTGRIRWHQLRHTAATLLVAVGTRVATIGRIRGHQPGSVVTLRYLHTADGRLRRAAEAVAEALQSACRTRRGSPRPTPRFSPLTRASRPT